MPLTCYRCGNVLVEGAGYCPYCGAPQIRVPEPEIESVADGLLPGTEPVAAARGEQIVWTRAFFACFMPALVAVVISSIGMLGMLSPVFMLGAGFAAVRLYSRRAQQAVISTAVGMRLGAVTGVVTFGLQLLLLGVFYAVAAATGHSFVFEMIRSVQELMRSTNAEATAFLQQITANPRTFAAFLAVSLLVTCIVSLVCSTLGGAISASLLKRRPRA